MAYKEPPTVTLTPPPTPQPTSTGSSSTFGGAFVNGLFGLGQSVLNNYFADKAATRQYNRQLEFWNMQNEYNSPLAQRERLQKAGMNPSGVAGEVASGQQAGELSSVPGNQYAQEGLLRLDALANTLETFARIEKIGAETDLNTAQLSTELVRQTLMGIIGDEHKVNTIIKELQAQGEATNLKYLDDYLSGRNKSQSVGIEKTESEIQEIGARIANINANTTLTEFESILADAKTAESKANAVKAYADARITNINAGLRSKWGDAQEAAKTKDLKSKAKYADSLFESTLQLQQSAAALNNNQAMTNDARVAIEQQLTDIKERALALENDKFGLEQTRLKLDAVNSCVNAISSMIDSVIPL